VPMTRTIAFLRAINVGGHTVKMETLRALFGSLGFSSVETFIASGNIVFESPAKSDRALEQKIEAAMKEALGYEVATFIRTGAELAQVAAYQPFPPAALEVAMALNVAFLADPLDDAAIVKLMALRTDIDDFHAHGREVYWLCRKKQSESKFSNAVFERALRVNATFRGAETVRKMAAKYGD
jgi:uncharacterized protein (DUF1697 family)